MSDDIRSMTTELAADARSLVFMELAEALRQRGQYAAAYKVARTGVGRYPELVAAHDLCARIQMDQDHVEAAFESWADALRLDPEHVGAHKGIAFLYYRAGDTVRAAEHLERAALGDPGDAGIRAALTRLGAVAPVAAAPDDDERGAEESAAFGEFDGSCAGVLLADINGLRLGGTIQSPDGRDASDAVAAQLAGVSREAARAVRLLDLGEWHSVAAESLDGSLHLLPPTDDTILLTVREPGVPSARLALVAERAATAARAWLERIG